jgi:hypothetical protein
MSNPDGASKQIGQQQWTCTSLLSTPDGASKQIGQLYCPCTSKLVKFPFEFIILKMFFAETYQFSRKLPGKRKFLRKFSRKFAHFRIIFAFCENGKNRFRFNPNFAL